MGLERAEIPLQTNGSEHDIRCQVTRRNATPEHAEPSGAIAATLSSALPRHARSMASHAGIIQATASTFKASPPDTETCSGFGRCYEEC